MLQLPIMLEKSAEKPLAAAWRSEFPHSEVQYTFGLRAVTVHASFDSCHNVAMTFLRQMFRELWRRMRYLFTW